MVSCYTVFNIYVRNLLFTPYRPKELIEYQVCECNERSVYAYEIEFLYCAFTSIATFDISKLSRLRTPEPVGRLLLMLM